MSCAGTGNCVAAGSTRAGVAMVSEQVHGVWQPAHQVPGLAALNPGGYSAIGVLSCSAAGWCVAAGTSWKPPKSFPNGRKSVPFVVIEHNGAWHKAQRIPGVLALNHGWLAIISAISCDSVGTCTAGGTYRDRAVDALRPFVVSEHRGAWKPARAIAGVTALPQAASSGNSGIGVMSRSSPGNCTAAGGYGTAKYESLPFVVAEKNGSWGRAQSLPGAIPSSQRYDQSAITGL